MGRVGLVVWVLGGPRTQCDFAIRSSGEQRGYRWGRDGGAKLGDDGLGWIGDRAMTFAGWRRVAVFA